MMKVTIRKKTFIGKTLKDEGKIKLSITYLQKKKIIPTGKKDKK